MSEATATPAASELNPAQAGLPPATGGVPEQAAIPPAAAPAAAPAPEATPSVEQSVPPVESDDGGVFTYEKTGDVALDMALGFVGKLGFGPEHPAIKAAQSGDFSILSAELAAKGDKATGWQEHVALAKSSHERAVAAVKARTDEVTNTATTMCKNVGADWGVVRSWASANATDAEKAYVNSALSQGGVAAKAALQFVLNAYVKSAQAVLTPGNAASENRGNAQPNNSGLLTAREYAKAVNDLSLKHGGRDVSHLPEYKALQAQRNAGRRAGK